jgi:ABC-type multidrug transport system fused ATPase/permease subunit
MAGRTVIAIAHRLSTLSRMDRLVVLDQGRIVEQGTHDQLLDEGGVYARLWARQAGGFAHA